VAGVGAAGLLAAGIAPVGAQEAMPATAPAEGAGLLPGLDPRLVGVGIEYASSPRDFESLKAAQTRRDALVQEQATLHTKQSELDRRLAFLSTVQQKASNDLVEAELDVDRLSALV